MTMTVRLWCKATPDTDEHEVNVSTSGKYSPDVMRDLTNRAREALEHSVGLQVVRDAGYEPTTEVEPSDSDMPPVGDESGTA